MKLELIAAFLALNIAALGHAAQTNLVANGSFEQDQTKPGVPDDWSCTGNPAVQQQLTLDTGRDGHPCALLRERRLTQQHQLSALQLGDWQQELPGLASLARKGVRSQPEPGPSN